MSQKVLEIQSTKINFADYFKQIINQENSKSTNLSFWDDVDYGNIYDEDYWNNYYDDTYWNDFYKNRYYEKDYCHKNKSKQKKKKASKSKSNIDNSQDYKTIYYYRDINNPDTSLTIFYNLYTFDDFLQEEGIKIDDGASLFLLNNDDIYCCSVKKDDETKLIVGTSFGNLHWAANSY